MSERALRAVAHAGSWVEQQGPAPPWLVRVDKPSEHDEILPPMTSAPSPASSRALVSEGCAIQAFSVEKCRRLGQ